MEERKMENIMKEERRKQGMFKNTKEKEERREKK